MDNGGKWMGNVGCLMIRAFCMAYSLPETWVIEGNGAVTRGVIVVSYLFVCSSAITIGPGTRYPNMLGRCISRKSSPLHIRAKAVTLD